MRLGRDLLAQGYRFTTITPATHGIVQARPHERPPTLRDIFGWSRPFLPEHLPPHMLAALIEAEALMGLAGHSRSTVRFSTLGDQIFVHSAFPTEQADAVFFGPDTYRFARAVRHSVATLAARPKMRILDVGAGSGAGGLHAASLLRHADPRLTLTDINHGALRFSRINAALNGVPSVEVVESDLLGALDGTFDLIISNPPYLVDPLARLYRHGGGELRRRAQRADRRGGHRAARARRAPASLHRLGDRRRASTAFHETLRERLKHRRDVRFAYEEIDPDVFGEELEHPPYDRVDRIAVVVATIDVEERIMSIAELGWTRWAGELNGTRFAEFQTGADRATTRRGLSRCCPSEAAPDELAREHAVARAEIEFVEAQRQAIAPLVADIPSDADGFIAWFERLKRDRPGPGRSAVSLARDAPRALEQMKWFLLQEVAGEAGFEDLLAMTQVKMPVQAKLEMARNFWDEMGRGRAKGMHGPMLERLAELSSSCAPTPETVVPESLALGNTMIALARHRRYAYHSVGALGVIEMTAPTRAGYVDQGLRRLGIPAKKRHYFALHAVLDVKHSEAWNREVLRPLVAEDPRRARAIGEGAVMRLWHGARSLRALPARVRPDAAAAARRPEAEADRHEHAVSRDRRLLRSRRALPAPARGRA